jgi:hypothetical protein
MSEIPAIQTPRSSAIRIWILSACLLIFVFGLGAWGVLKWRYRVMPLAPSQTKVVARLSASPAGASSPAPQKHDSPVQIITEYEQTRECADPTRRDVVRRLTEELKPGVPELAGILLPDEPEEPEKVYPALLRLLESAKIASAERRPALLLAADLVAERVNLPNIYPPSPEVQRKLDELASYGVTFRWFEMAGDYGNQRDLLWQAWRDYPATPAGEGAFALLLDTGWDTSACCQKGSDAFRNVIREAEQFLASRPNSSHRLDVEFAAAEAYETWWSLSHAPLVSDNEDDPSPQAYREGAEAARAKAIAYYDEVARTAPDSTQTKCSRRSLEMLKQNQDTHHRRFFCHCD